MKKFLFIFFIFMLGLSINSRAIDEIEKLENKLKVSAEKEKIPILLDLANKYKDILPEKTFEFAKHAIRLSQKLNDKTSEADAYVAWGEGLGEIGEYSKAIDDLDQAIKKYETIGNQLKIARAVSSIGVMYERSENAGKALEHYNQALKMFEALDSKKDVITTLVIIGKLNGDKHQFDVAIKYFEKATELAKVIGDKYLQAVILNDLGNIYRDKKDDAKALECYYNSLNLRSEIGNKEAGNFVYYNIGGIDNLRRNDDAMEFYLKSLTVLEKIGDKRGMALILKYIGKIYQTLGDEKAAMENIEKSIAIASQFNYRDILVEDYQIAADALKEGKNSKKAIEYLHKYYQLKDTITNQLTEKNLSKSRLVAKLRASEAEQANKSLVKKLLYQAERNQKLLMTIAIALLIATLILFIFYTKQKVKSANEVIAKNKELEEAYNELKISQKELHMVNMAKDKFFNIATHDLKGPIGVLRSLNNVIISNFDTAGKDELKENIEDQKSLIEHLNRLLESLLQWSRIKSGTISYNPETANLKYITDNISTIFKLDLQKKNIKFETNVDDTLGVYSDVGMLMTVLTNVISNAVKFTNDGGKIVLTAMSQGDDAVIKITDNGVGISKDNMGKIFMIDEQYTTPGTRNETGAGMGLLVSNEYIDMNNGSMTLDSETGKGTTVVIKIPKEK